MNRIKEKAMVSWYIVKIEFTKDSGKMIYVMEKAMNAIVMGILMKATFSTEKLMVKECTIGPMEKSTMANGSRVSRKDMECGKASMVTAIWANGANLKLTVMEFISGKMEIGMKETGNTV